MVMIPAKDRSATYRAKQLAKATAMAKRVEELEDCLRWIVEREKVSTSAAAYEMANKARQALEGSAKP